jgi:hypothetical protein
MCLLARWPLDFGLRVLVDDLYVCCVIAQFVARRKGYKIEGQTNITGTNPTVDRLSNTGGQLHVP